MKIIAITPNRKMDTLAIFIIDGLYDIGVDVIATDFGNNVKLLIEKNARGLFNMVCGGFTGRLEVARELILLKGLQESLTIEEVSSEFFAEEYFAERPECERLVNKRLDELGLNIMRDWRIALKEYLNEYY